MANSDFRETRQIINHSTGVDKSYQKICLLTEFEPPCQKLWAFLSSFGSFDHAHLLNMVMSRDPICKFQSFYFVLILHLILGKVTKFLVEKLSPKNLTGGTPSVP